MGSGHKTFAFQSTPSSGDIQGYLMDQSNMVFDTPAARDAALAGKLQDGMECYIRSTNTKMVYDSTVTLPASNDGGWYPLLSAWQEYTPVWDNLNPGDATVEAVWRWEDMALRQRGQIYFGASTTVTGIVLQHLHGSDGGATFVHDDWSSGGSGVCNNSSIKIEPITTHVAPGSHAMSFSSAAGLVTATVPFTWATGDVLTWDLRAHPTLVG